MRGARILPLNAPGVCGQGARLARATLLIVNHGSMPLNHYRHKEYSRQANPDKVHIAARQLWWEKYRARSGGGDRGMGNETGLEVAWFLLFHTQGRDPPGRPKTSEPPTAVR